MLSFVKKIFITNILIIAVGTFPFLIWGSEYWIELLSSFSISLINAFVGYYLAINSINKPDPEFYKNVYGGMLIRMTIVFGFSIYIILNNFVITVPYMLFLLFFYKYLHQIFFQFF